MTNTQSLDELFGEEESILERRARERRERAATPEGQAENERFLEKARERREAEHARGVRLGWWNEDGEPIEQPEDEDDADAEDDAEGDDDTSDDEEA